MKAAINPEFGDDGAFWVEKKEFFKYFKTFYLCAQDMLHFLR